MSSLLVNIILDNQRRRRQRNHVRIMLRRLRDSQNQFENTTDTMFRELYRFPKHLCLDLINDLKPYMKNSSRNFAIPVSVKVLCALRFYASGSFQRSVGQDVFSSMSKSSVSRYITEVTEAINKIARHHVKIPNSDEYPNIKRNFFEICSFPGIIGVIDGTHIKIVTPKEDEHVYYCRKGGHSLNVQIACDANYMIMNLNARFGGTAHDAYIWRQSNFHKILEFRYRNGNRNSWLLGDSGYPLQPWLMTPISTTSTPSEERFNNAHKVTRNIIERCIGILKSRFRCLSKERALYYDPLKSGKIVNACAVLHNILIKSNVPIPENLELDDNLNQDLYEATTETAEEINLTGEGRRIQQFVIRTHFS